MNRRKTTGAKIRTARQSSGLTLREMGKRAGMSAGDISSHENGRRYPSLRTLEKYAEAMGCKLVVRFEFEDRSSSA